MGLLITDIGQKCFRNSLCCYMDAEGYEDVHSSSEKVSQMKLHWWSLLKGICWLDISTRSLLL